MSNLKFAFHASIGREASRTTFRRRSLRRSAILWRFRLSTIAALPIVSSEPKAPGVVGYPGSSCERSVAGKDSRFASPRTHVRPRKEYCTLANGAGLLRAL